MGWSDTWLDSARDGLVSLRGAGTTSAAGVQLPNLSAMDMLAVVGVLTPPTATALGNWSGSLARVAAPLNCIDEDGQLTVPGLTMMDRFMSAKLYLTGFCDVARSRPWIRASSPTGLDSESESFSVYNKSWPSNQEGLYSYVKQLVADYTHLCDAVAMAIQNSPAGGATLPMSGEDMENCWSYVGAMCSDLDVLQENPPASIDVGAALRSTLHDTERFVGQAIADVSHEVGEAAGNIASGFFSEAGLLSVAVAGIAVFLYLK